jgi:predicted acylesterase/phospholipase RssA
MADTHCYAIRAYYNPNGTGDLREIKTWEAARATSAAPTFFKPIEIGPNREKWCDGGLQHNNPVRLLDREANDVFPHRRKIIISIGTGTTPEKPMEKSVISLIKTIKSIATETEKTAALFQESKRNEITDGHLQYYRFNVTGLGGIGLEEWEKLGDIQSRTRTYLDHPNTRDLFRRCVAAIVDALGSTESKEWDF